MNDRIELPAHSLGEHHLLEAKVWRFLGIGESTDPDADESQVLAQEAGPSQGEYASYLVAARFKLKNGTSLPGLVQVDLLGKQVECTPVSVFAKGKAIDPLGKDTASRLERILGAKDAQPIAWQLEVHIGGEVEPRAATIARPGVLQALSLLAQLGRLHRSR